MDTYVFLLNELAETYAEHIVSKGRSRALPVIVVGLLAY